LLFLGDALHTQKDTVTAILHKRADYLFVVKGNQKELFEAISLVFSEEKIMKNIYHAPNKSSFLKDSFTIRENRRKRSVATAVSLTHDTQLMRYIKETYGWEGIQTIGLLKRTGTRISKDGTVTE